MLAGDGVCEASVFGVSEVVHAGSPDGDEADDVLTQVWRAASARSGEGAA